MGEAGRNGRESAADIRIFKVRSAVNHSERYRIEAGNYNELITNIKKRFNFKENDVLELRYESDSALVQSDSDLHFRIKNEFLTVYNLTRGEPHFEIGVPPRKKRKNQVNNIYNIEKVENMQVGKVNGLEV
ncbi:hypothetical protein KUTeg_012322 [Tegillarca granosa]|uniref:Ubiquitin-like domain-containing protein n=1 Tax=Tegillarca granosa TaxID=220873 RepID=A0ABQ9F2H2_TEGGR|nr:hypothetical protein KUTeg_012322 [Tegillarca granosa]